MKRFGLFFLLFIFKWWAGKGFRWKMRSKKKQGIGDYLSVSVLLTSWFGENIKIMRMKYVLKQNLLQELLKFVLESSNGYFWSTFYQVINSFASTKFWLFVVYFLYLYISRISYIRLEVSLKSASSQTIFCNASSQQES